jgi:hypothetical protein
MASEMLRKLAAELRDQAETDVDVRMVKVGKALQAARALLMVQDKVKTNG